MSDAEKYLKRIDGIQKDIERKMRYRQARNTYRERGKDLATSFKVMNDYLNASWEKLYSNRGDAQAAANVILEHANKPNAYIAGAELYEKLGKGKKIIPTLMKRVEESVKQDVIDPSDLERVKNFIKRNANKKESSLVGKLSAFILFILSGIALSAFSLTATGYVISSLTQTTSGLLGILLLIVGLAGIFLNPKR